MIRRITGTVCDNQPGQVVVDVAGVGYLVYTNLDVTKLQLDTSITLHTYLAVRETALDLYGFSTRDELDVFIALLSLPKIGPKSALQIITQADVALIKTAVANEDPAHLSKLSGITKKTAEKIVTGLQGVWAEMEPVVGGASAAGAADHLVRDAIDALIALGYPQTDARKAVQQLPDSITNTNEAVKVALQTLNRV